MMSVDISDRQRRSHNLLPAGQKVQVPWSIRREQEKDLAVIGLRVVDKGRISDHFMRHVPIGLEHSQPKRERNALEQPLPNVDKSLPKADLPRPLQRVAWMAKLGRQLRAGTEVRLRRGIEKDQKADLETGGAHLLRYFIHEDAADAEAAKDERPRWLNRKDLCEEARRYVPQRGPCPQFPEIGCREQDDHKGLIVPQLIRKADHEIVHPEDRCAPPFAVKCKNTGTAIDVFFQLPGRRLDWERGKFRAARSHRHFCRSVTFA